MVFRIPSQLETFVPPPFTQRTHPAPWRGKLLVSGMRTSDRGSNQELHVTAVETDGDKAQYWPDQFNARVLYDKPRVLHEFRAWMEAYRPPLPVCTFMPNRLRDSDANAINQTAFRSLSGLLFEQGVVAIAAWAPNSFTGSGMIIYPSSNSSAVLIGALFFDTRFPAFIPDPPPPMPRSPSHPAQSPHSAVNSPYGQKMISVAPYEGPSISRQGQSLSPQRLSNPNSPLIEQPIAQHRQHDPYRFMLPQSGYPDVGQDENAFNNYASSSQNPPFS